MMCSVGGESGCVGQSAGSPEICRNCQVCSRVGSYGVVGRLATLVDCIFFFFLNVWLVSLIYYSISK